MCHFASQNSCVYDVKKLITYRVIKKILAALDSGMSSYTTRDILSKSGEGYGLKVLGKDGFVTVVSSVPIRTSFRYVAYLAYV